MRQTVHDFLGRSPVAAAIAEMDLGEGCAVTIWQNGFDRIRYETPQNHTFSLYLEGGTGTRRTDRGGVPGFPGAICIMPEGCGSAWEIGAPFRFVHLYLSDAGLYGALVPQPVKVQAGLPPHLLRRVDDWIDAHLDQAIHLEDLAALAGLSGFHFHRMFRLSRGVAPHAWVTARRTERARAMLHSGQPIAGIAAACGFSSQSHLTRVFHRQTGSTPASYRAALL